jgi:hypothetical protein
LNLGKTEIQSQVQPKLTNYTPTSIEDLEDHFYDKLNMSVNDVQIILVPNKVDWKDYLNNCEKLEYKYHILYPVTTINTLYLSINPSYKKLPKMKLDAICSSIGLNFSDNKILKLFDFSQKFPLPEVPKTSTPTGVISSTAVTTAMAKPASTGIGTAEKAITAAARKKEKEGDLKLTFPQLDTNAVAPEPDDEWDGPFRLATQINGDPIPNYPQLSLNLLVTTFSINLKSTNEYLKDEDPKQEQEYLKFFLNDIRIDFAITKYGFSFRAGLGDLKLVDKIHPTDTQSETEILSSLSSEDIIKFYFRQVEEDAPNFATLYGKILSNLRFDCSNIRVACHRTVIVYFLNYAKRIVDNITIETRRTSPPTNETVATPVVEDKSKDFAASSIRKI